VVSQTKIEFVYENSIYFALLVHRQEYRNEVMTINVSQRETRIYFRFIRNHHLLIFEYLKHVFLFVKPLSCNFYFLSIRD
jgi:hypothetical protein